MLYPQSNRFRQQVDLSGVWDFRFDPQNEGDQASWQSGFTGARPAAVPASWNEQFEDGRDYLGVAWYQTEFTIPWGWAADKHSISVRFESVNYSAEVWLNGVQLGAHEGGHLPFEFDITKHIRPANNRLVVRVDGELTPDRVPPGNLASLMQQEKQIAFEETNFPAGSFDFFPFCGIQRPVTLIVAPREGISDLTVLTDIADRDGRVRVQIKHNGAGEMTARVALKNTDSLAEAVINDETKEVLLEVPDAHFWSPASPYLYDLHIELVQGTSVLDEYSLQVGIRTIRVQGDQLLLNGEPVYLRGFGRHEDFPVIGRGYAPAVIVKDYALMQWMGANSFRTTHYPYSETMMQLADRLGFLVIDETPAVGLFFANEGLEQRLELCKQYTKELIARDKNHPSVIMWSLANEPHSQQYQAESSAFFSPLFDLARSLDSSRPLTMTSYIGLQEPAYEFADVLSLNRYAGWYSQPGQLDEAIPVLSAELDALHQKFNKPIIVTEFGADALAGHHAQPPEMFSEEYQADMLEQYIQLFRTKAFVIGEHIWNLCDFKTGQSVRRVGGLNLKGIFTRDRRPKLAAHRVRALWTNPTTKD
ncbi:MAG: beta-glucuronidase [Anaerolineae bacterium]|nr:beta-glucuronidase [Anaerolineae bacterium]